MKKKKKHISDNVSEPLAVYNRTLKKTSKNEIVISSLEEQEEANYLFWLSLSPLERLQLHFEMASVFWRESLLKKRKDKKIIIVR